MGSTFPVTLGWDLAGIVVASGTPAFAVGDRVIGISAQIATGVGTWAELVALPADQLAPAPASVSLPEAATLPLAGLTALQALGKLALKDGERLLVTGAVGGVGGIAVQLARRAGVSVDALVSREGHVADARALTPDGLVAYDPAQLPPATYDAILDTAAVHVNAALAAGGRYVSVADGDLPDIPNASKSITRLDNGQLAELGRLVDADEIRPRVAGYLPAGEVRAAHRRVEAGGLAGKAVLLF
jgi:NADPH:quinone reductase-like Zn-dependent oxidoreductase